MNRSTIKWVMLGALVCGVAFTAEAAEKKSASSSSAKKSTSASSQTMTAEGTISAIDLKAAPATVTVTAASGKAVSVIVDPLATQVLQNSAKASFDQLKAGQWVKVRYTAKNGKEVAKSIQIGSAPVTTTSKTN